MTELFFYLGSFIFLLKMFCMFCFLQTVYFIIKLIEIVYVCFLNFHMTKLLFKKNCPCPPERAQAFCFVFFCYKSFKSKCKQNSPFIDLFPRRIFFFTSFCSSSQSYKFNVFLFQLHSIQL